MSNTAVSAPLSLPSAWRQNWALTTLLVISIVLIGITAIGAVVDGRTISNVNGWIKPMKFGFSFVAYSITLIWMLSYVENRPRLVAFISISTLVTGVAEMVLIALQVFRNTTSHFNVSTPFDATVYYLMGLFVLILWFGTLALAILLMGQKFTDRAFGWSLRLGVIIAFIGAGFGIVMTSSTTPAQDAVIAAQGDTAYAGSHSVGAEDGEEAGLPFVGWNTRSGDVRVAHFFGLHGLQVVPLLALALNWWRHPNLNARKRLNIVLLGGLGYLAFVLLTFWQAMRGQALIAPDALTLIAFGALIVVTVVPALLMIVRK